MYTLHCDEKLINPERFEGLQNVEEITIQILTKYLDRYYSIRHLAEERNHYQLKPLSGDDEKILRSYKVKVTEENKSLADYLQKIVDDKTIYDRRENRPPQDIRFTGVPVTFRNALYKGHLFQPLLVKVENERVITIPTGLNEGETRFVDDLNRYLVSTQVADGVYLLRNQTRGKGIGFFEYHSFYPDFIMWIVKNGKQTIVFIDPKGLIHLGLEDQKLNLHTHIKNEVLPALDNPAVNMDAFIVSRTPYIEAKKIHGNLSIGEYEGKHLLFQEMRDGIPNQGYVDRLFQIALRND